MRPEDIPGGAGAAPARTAPPATEARLTPRELEVLGLLAEGIGNKGIATRLAISERTVKFHIAAIFDKLGVTSRTEAVTAGLRRGLILLESGDPAMRTQSCAEKRRSESNPRIEDLQTSALPIGNAAGRN